MRDGHGGKSKHILAVKRIDTDIYLKQIVNFNGIVLNYVVDKIEWDNKVIKKIKNKNLWEISNNEITYGEENMNLQPIKASFIIKQKHTSFIENPNFGVIDLESYTDSKTEKGRV